MTINKRRFIVRGFLWLAATYLFGPLVIFDLRNAASAFDEEYHNGVRVAFGPRPWWFLAYPTYHDFLYDGSEWPFHVFRPFCDVWLHLNEYEKPHRWREDR